MRSIITKKFHFASMLCYSILATIVVVVEGFSIFRPKQKDGQLQPTIKIIGDFGSQPKIVAVKKSQKVFSFFRPKKNPVPTDKNEGNDSDNKNNNHEEEVSFAFKKLEDTSLFCPQTSFHASNRDLTVGIHADSSSLCNPSGNFYYHNHQTNILKTEPKGFDVRQGNISDCFFLQTLSAIAHASPITIQNNIQEATDKNLNNNDSQGVTLHQKNHRITSSSSGNYIVNFYHLSKFNSPTDVYRVQVNDQVLISSNPKWNPKAAIPKFCPSPPDRSTTRTTTSTQFSSKVPTSKVIWPILYEKAYTVFLQHLEEGIYWFRGKSKGNYKYLDHGGSPTLAAYHITGDDTYQHLDLTSLNIIQRKYILSKNGHYKSRCPLILSTTKNFSNAGYYALYELKKEIPFISECIFPWHILPVFGSDSNSVHIYCDRKDSLIKLPLRYLDLFVSAFILRSHSDCVDSDWHLAFKKTPLI